MVFHGFPRVVHIKQISKNTTTYQKTCEKMRRREQICFGARPTRFWRHLGPYWAPLGRHLARFWALLGGSWPLLGAPWAHLGRFLGALGRFLVGLGWILGAFWLRGALQASILEGSGTCRAGFLDALRAMFRCILYDLTVVAPCFCSRSNHAFSFTCASGASHSITFDSIPLSFHSTPFQGSRLLEFQSRMLPRYRWAGFPTSSLQSASAGCAKRKQFNSWVAWLQRSNGNKAGNAEGGRKS